MKAEYPFYTQVTIPAGTYRGLNTDVETVAVMAMLATRADLPEDLVYEMTASIFDNLDVLAATHAAGRAISVAGALEGMPIEPGLVVGHRAGAVRGRCVPGVAAPHRSGGSAGGGMIGRAVGPLVATVRMVYTGTGIPTVWRDGPCPPKSKFSRL